MEFTTEQQWHFLGDFTQRKLEVGEPSPHMKIVGHLSRDCSWEEKVWRAGCYGVPYSIITAEVLWTEWPFARALSDPRGLESWIHQNWSNIHTRTERRCVRTPAKFSECLLGYARWAERDFAAVLGGQYNSNAEAYDALWGSISSVKYLGRYINIRILELLHRYAGVEAHLYDIRSIGGWSPKKMLAFLYPEHSAALLSSGVEGDKLADHLATEALHYYQRQGLDVDFYVFAAMLCEYREAYEDRHQYPARTHDQEIEYFHKKGRVWEEKGFCFQMFNARREIFPHECLGELQGWSGIRHDLSRVLRDYGYNWCDTLFCYGRTNDYSQPAARA